MMNSKLTTFLPLILILCLALTAAVLRTLLLKGRSLDLRMKQGVLLRWNRETAIIKGQDCGRFLKARHVVLQMVQVHYSWHE